MADTDLITCVYSYGDWEFGHAQKAIEDSLRYMSPKLPPHVPQETCQLRGARESTEPPGNRDDDDDNDDNLDTLLYIEMRFSEGPRIMSRDMLLTTTYVNNKLEPTVAAVLLIELKIMLQHTSRFFFFTCKYAQNHVCIITDLESRYSTGLLSF